MQLLVSVRSGDEALLATAGGADVIDAKDPSAGALGAVSPPTFAAIVDAVRSRLPVTAAAGEADEPGAVAARVFALVRAGAVFVKVGFAGLDRGESVGCLIASAAKRATAAGGGLVAVAYADHEDVDCLPPDAIVAAAAGSGASGVLLDTATKTGRGLLQRMTADQLDAWVRGVHARGMFAAVAGQLNLADLDVARRCGADIAGVRGAACAGSREGAVSEERVRALAAALPAWTRRTSSTAMPAAALAQNTGRRYRHHRRPPA